MRGGWLAVTLAAVAVMAVGRPACAFHTVFDFTVDRFEADGNVYGPHDGVPDYVSDFDVDANGWLTPYGSSRVSGGRLHVQSLGTHLPGPDGSTLDLTGVTSRRYVFTWFGVSTAPAVFDSVMPPEGHFYHFTIYTFGGPTYFSEIFGIDVHTLGGETRIEQHMVILDLTHGIYQTVATEGRTVTAAELPPQSLFRLLYDDASGTIRSAFSLDGGATFQSPFSSVPIFTAGRSSGLFILGADPHLGLGATSTSTTTTPSTSLPTTTLPLGTCVRSDCRVAPDDHLTVRSGANGQTTTWRWRGAPSMPLVVLGDPRDPVGPKYPFCIRDADGRLVGNEAPAGGACAGRRCWRALGRSGFAYRNPRTRDGLTLLRVLADGRAGSEVFARMKAPPGSTAPSPPLTVQLETSEGTCWTSSIDASALTIRHARGRTGSSGY